MSVILMCHVTRFPWAEPFPPKDTPHSMDSVVCLFLHGVLQCCPYVRSIASMLVLTPVLYYTKSYFLRKQRQLSMAQQYRPPTPTPKPMNGKMTMAEHLEILGSKSAEHMAKATGLDPSVIQRARTGQVIAHSHAKKIAAYLSSVHERDIGTEDIRDLATCKPGRELPQPQGGK